MVDAQDKDGLLQEIASEQARLRRLEQESELVRARLQRLKAGLDGAPTPIASAPAAYLVTPTKPTSMEKVRLFRALFRGREDVFATRFVSRKTGKPGYAPACANKWVQGVCGLPRIKCGECTNQAFVPVSDQIIIDHLLGQHVVGISSREMEARNAHW